MTKKAISVTLSPESLRYVRAKALREKRRSVSDALDALIHSFMQSDEPPRSVVGTIAAPSDLDERELDQAVRDWFHRGLVDPSKPSPTPPPRPRSRPPRPRRRA